MYTKEKWIGRSGISRVDRICLYINRKIVLSLKLPIDIEVEDGLGDQEIEEIKKELESAGWNVNFIHREDGNSIPFTDMEIY